MEFKNLRLSFEGALATITLDRPPVNALNKDTLSELSQSLDIIEAKDEVRVVLITSAAKKAFIAGADIVEFTKISSSQVGELIQRGQDLFDRIEAYPIPVMAVINGPCLGGGCELAMACHLRIASEEASFGQLEINLGIIPGWGGTQRLPRLIGRTRGVELLLTGAMIDSKEALQLGLINKVTTPEELEAQAQKLAGKIAGKAPLAISAILSSVAEGFNTSFQEGEKIEGQAFKKVFATEDAKEGIRSFLEKRPPRFTKK